MGQWRAEVERHVLSLLPGFTVARTKGQPRYNLRRIVMGELLFHAGVVEKYFDKISL